MGRMSKAEKDRRAYEIRMDQRIELLEAELSKVTDDRDGVIEGVLDVVVKNKMTYAEFISGLPNPTSFNLLSAPPLEGMMCLEISPLIIYPVIDRLLGGTNQELFIPQRPLTSIEERLIHRLLDKGLASLNEAWGSLKKVEFELSGSESNPQLVQIVPPNEVVVVVGWCGWIEVGGRWWWW
jgi:flagellar motor switch protein FliM